MKAEFFVDFYFYGFVLIYVKFQVGSDRPHLPVHALSRNRSVAVVCENRNSYTTRQVQDGKATKLASGRAKIKIAEKNKEKRNHQKWFTGAAKKCSMSLGTIAPR